MDTGAADLYTIKIGKLDLCGWFTVDEQAIFAFQVFNVEAVAFIHQAGVISGNRTVIKENLTRFIPADHVIF